ncbi:polysaccharide biosynthesis/export family protein [Sphingobium phenoxybenzoativorans]|uniref:polysaccharide biosynthesis/export family protein n=1 Tax=Sphingobium phenoxybenzoativorans TaxID=1592790 RepID=UPI0031BBB835
MVMMLLLKFISLPCIVLLCACASLSDFSLTAHNSRMQLTDLTELPPPPGIDVSMPDRGYRIGPFDQLLVDVFEVPELSGKEIQAASDGSIAFPLIGSIEAAGMTTDELAAIVAARLRENFVKNPQVTVSLQKTVSQVVTVDGEVNEPGLYPVIGQMTLRKAIASAKGAKAAARLGRVAIYRKVNDQDMAAVYNLTAIYRGAYADPEIFAGDIVVVGSSQTGRIFKGIKAPASLMDAPLVVAIRAGE